MKKRKHFIFSVTRKFHVGIAVALLFLFLIPYPVKLADTIYHKHYISDYQGGQKSSIELPSHLCPIPGFKFHSFIFEINNLKPEGNLYLHKVELFNTLETYFSPYVLSFTLRGPPLLDPLS